MSDRQQRKGEDRPRPAPAGVIRIEERRRAARRRRDLEVYDALPVGVLVLDADGTILRSNPTAHELFCRPAAQLRGRSLSDPALALAPVGTDGRPLPEAERPFGRALRSGAPVHDVVLGVARPDGERVWLLETAHPLRNAAGAIEQVILTFMDVTARQQAEAALRQSEEQFRLLADNATDLISRHTPQGIYLYVSPACRTLLGYTPDELVGRPAGELAHPEDLPALMAFHAALPDRADALTVSYRMRRKDGRYVWVETRSHTIRDAQTGAVVEFQCATRDITKRRRAEELYRGLLEAAPDAIVTHEPDGRIVLVNSQVERLYGYRHEELIGQPVELLLPEPLQNLHVRHRAADDAYPPVLAMGAGRDLQARRKDGSTFPVEVNLGTLTSDSSMLFIAIIRDATAHREMEDALRRASRAKSEFLAAMSHELRTPLNGVLGLASLLHQTPLDAHQGEYVEGIQAAGETLLTLIGDVLDLAKIEAGQLTLEEVPVALRPLVEGVLEMVAPQAQAAGLALLAYVAPPVPEVLRGDPLRLRQVLLNLVGNALKFTPQGAVVVRVGRASAGNPIRVRISVSDTGIGIAPEAQGHIFAAFTQADRSTTRRYGGTGLGLAICRQVVEAMGGHIGVGSMPGRGSVFTLSVPLARAEVGDVAPPPPPLAVRVLLVCEPAPLRQALRDQLGDWGVTVRSVVGVHMAGVALAEDRPYDVVLVAERDGLEVARRLREGGLPETLPLVLLTPSAVAEGAAAQLGLSAHLLLPVRAERLHAALARLATAAPPPHSAPAAGRPSPPALPPSPNGAGGRVLVAEDNPINRLVAVGMLQSLGCAVETVENGRQAVEAVQQQGDRFDLVLMDVHMPELDGIAATLAIREQERVGAGRRRLPIVALTADVQPQDAEKSRAAGMDDHLTKPITLERLAAVLKRWVTPRA
jgi:PAS domain S-box-containing protein